MAGIRRDGAHVQRQRIRQMAKDLELELKKGGGETSLKRFQAICQYDYGLNWKTTRKYLTTLEIIQICKVDDKNDLIMEWYDVDALKSGTFVNDEAGDKESTCEGV